ncbi:hypothetical protein [Streptomyces sp. ME19-01-6]|uniref:hypothetical protein n=1 Tax=Streptomyces sp. ME19-01-6 TaxID=3028686 RepID=UPI0029BB0D12|nr:hypothetical protein [Streptomyces sp. ME19-01-6]MDX3231027.1 hypothetical protein [Streptomyces sp. ME19-01-6]
MQTAQLAAEEMIMGPAPGDARHSTAADQSEHPLRTIRDIRDSLPDHQQRLFDAELADTEFDALPAMLNRWITLGTDGFEEFLLSAPFEGLEFGARSYDVEAESE